ncbi:hypothetical protein Cadr_000016240 [Camelus dromedarius]|uniref:Uncharacterized protein n=1 Tax=Camelus dromedarius TaxID=9838 RepID=A0A5N4EAW8_CAMDR|nr:hypothetical protein Cadr_000016240 [Camelus dromedarius]
MEPGMMTHGRGVGPGGGTLGQGRGQAGLEYLTQLPLAPGIVTEQRAREIQQVTAHLQNPITPEVTGKESLAPGMEDIRKGCFCRLNKNQNKRNSLG